MKWKLWSSEEKVAVGRYGIHREEGVTRIPVFLPCGIMKHWWALFLFLSLCPLEQSFPRPDVGVGGRAVFAFLVQPSPY